jgi:putative transposase
MRRFSGACRFVYNKALALQKERHERGEKKLSAFELNNLLPHWKAEPVTKWLSESPSQTLLQAIVSVIHKGSSWNRETAGYSCLK